MQNYRTLIAHFLLGCFFVQTLPVSGQSGFHVPHEEENSQPGAVYSAMLGSTGAASELPVALFGDHAETLAAEFARDSEAIFTAVVKAGVERAESSLERAITDRRESPAPKPVLMPVNEARPAKKRGNATKKFTFEPTPDWRQFAFGFPPLLQQTPDVQVTENEKEISTKGSEKKSFETNEAKGTRTQNVETKYIKDGRTFGVEIRDTQLIEAVSKPDGKTFRREFSMVWGAKVGACPDVNGISSGDAMAKVISKTTYSDGGAPVTMISEFDLQAKVVGNVSDQADLTHYDMTLDAYTTISGYEAALERGLKKEVKIKDGRYGLKYDIPGNTVQISDGTYGGKRTPAKMGQVSAVTLTDMSRAQADLVGKAIGAMIPAIWNSANDMYKSAEKNWKNYGCVEVICRVPKLDIEEGEQVEVLAESVHIFEKTKFNAQLKGEAYGGDVTPEEDAGRPGVTFAFTSSGESGASLYVESVSKRGIGKGEVEFLTKDEEPEAAGNWKGVIRVESKKREEREKRSGANLAENGGYIDTVTNVQLNMSGRLDRSVDANNAYIADVTGTQELVDHEFDRYLVDEGYCGAAAVPFKGPKEILRTSTTTATFDRETRVYLEADTANGTVTFLLPEIDGTTLHKYVHRSSCPDHDRANTSETSNDGSPVPGGSYWFPFPIDPRSKTATGSLTLRGDDGTVTTFTWELSRE
jgi:hypothetical protein